MQQNKATFFFETGTWKGDGLAYAAKYPFEKLYSSEIIDSIAENAKKRFKNDNRTEIITSASTQALDKTLNKLYGNGIFWLDAHFPGAEEGLKNYNEVDEENIKLPLQKELEIISKRKQENQDIILIDDLRIYEIGDYKSGNLPDNVLPPQVRDLKFVYQIFGDSHDIFKFYDDEGYLALIPKKKSVLTPFKTLYFKMYNTLFGKLI